MLAAQSAALTAAHPAAHAWVYRNANAGSMFALQQPAMVDPAKADWFLGPASVDPKYHISWRSLNFSNPDAAGTLERTALHPVAATRIASVSPLVAEMRRAPMLCASAGYIYFADWYIDTVVGEAAAEPEVAGVFFDEVDAVSCVPGGSGRLYNDTIATFRRACDALHSCNKGCVLSVVNTFASVGAGAKGAPAMCPEPEESMLEIMGTTGWWRYYQHWMNGFASRPHASTTPAVCASMISNVVAEGSRAVPVVARVRRHLPPLPSTGAPSASILLRNGVH